MGEQLTRREELEAALRAHIAAHGEKDWKVVQSKFPDVADRTFWRAVARARSSDADSARQIEDARRRVAANIAHVSKVRVITDPTLEAAGVQPLSKVAGLRDLALLTHLQRLLDDVEMLREFSLKPDGGIKNPHTFAQQISQGDRLLNTAVAIGERVMDLEYQAAFYEELQSIIVDDLAEVPDLQARVIVRIKEFNERSLMLGGRRLDR